MNFIPKKALFDEIVDELRGDELGVKDGEPSPRWDMLDVMLDACRRREATHVVLFQCLDLCSSQVGRVAAVLIGPRCTYKSVEDVHNRHLGSVPSRFMWPVKWAEVPSDLRLSDERRSR